MKKSLSKKTKLIVAATLVGVVCIGGTYAYFTDKVDLVNTFNFSGHVDIEADEDMKNPNDASTDIEYKDPENPVPGQEVSKKPYFINKGAIPVYVRAKVEFINPEDLSKPTYDDKDNWLSEDCLLNNGNEEAANFGVCKGWTKQGETEQTTKGSKVVYNYDSVVPANDNTKHYLFTGVKIPKEWNNADLGKKTLEKTVTVYYNDVKKTTPVFTKTELADGAITYEDATGAAKTEDDFAALTEVQKGNFKETKSYSLEYSQSVKILVSFEAVQAVGFDNAEDAWNAVGNNVIKANAYDEVTEGTKEP